MDREELIAKIRSDATLRRHVSRYGMLMTALQADTGGSFSTQQQQMQKLYQRLDSIWMALLQLPAIDHDDNKNNKSAGWEISLILPAYKECGASVAHTLRCAWNHCTQPDKVQVIVVDAGRCTDLDIRLSNLRTEVSISGKLFWGDLKLVQYCGSKGRGACQNFGSLHATGRILTFLHSDTLVPKNWDGKVKATLRSTNDNFTVHACSFSVGHNVSKDGLNGMPYPWGIRSILFLGNFRAYLFRLPYGDHILSFPAAYFFYVGGFPDQTIMEDYEIMDLFRQRAKVLRESLCIIPPPTGQCSVRRWQKFGVVYVTLANALIVNRYASKGWTADEIFDYYYRRPFKNNKQS
jgi:hypothetical protein